ncbi:MAG: DUF1287 domain-containing protein [Opitutaceae bacterium]
MTPHPHSLLLLLACILAGCDQPKPIAQTSTQTTHAPSVPQAQPVVATSPIVTAARSQIGKTTTYDASYVGLTYPGGDLPIEKGVCTDVVIRALRDGINMDLQKLVHEDMNTAFSKYPKIWGLKKTDRNIDHRRVPNLQTFFHRQGHSIEVTQNPADYLPGDLVTCTVGRHLAHVMIVSDQLTQQGVPMVIHNIGSGTQEENRLFEFPITGHYRINGH